MTCRATRIAFKQFFCFLFKLSYEELKVLSNTWPYQISHEVMATELPATFNLFSDDYFGMQRLWVLG
uniref:Putative zinc finger y-chromosomal protein n=1 Tax=Ixodes ricinus TaxID=34613 RepID=A0A131Y8X6_IXORI